MTHIVEGTPATVALCALRASSRASVAGSAALPLPPPPPLLEGLLGIGTQRLALMSRR